MDENTKLATLQAVISGQPYSVTGAELESFLNPAASPSDYFVVDGGKPTTYTEVGTWEKPFRTIQAAINAASNGMSIYIMPGQYSENIVMRDLDAVSFIGSAECNTVVTNAVAGHTFSWIPDATAGAAVATGAITNITFANTDTTGTYHAFHIDANAVVYPNTFMADEWDLNLVDIDGAGTVGQTTVYMRNVGAVFWTHGQIVGGDLTLLNAAIFRARQLEVGTLAAPMNANVTYAGANAHNGLGRNDVTFGQASVVWGDLIPNGHPILQVDSTSLVVGTTGGGTLTSYYSSGRDYCPMFSLYGQFGLLGGTGGAITFVFPDPQTSGSAFNICDLSGAHFPSLTAVQSFTKTNFLPANTRGIAYVLGQAIFDTAATNGISVNGYVALDLRRAGFNQSALQATGAAVVDRDMVSFTTGTITASPTAVAISPPFPLGTTYSVSVCPSVTAAYSVTSKTVAGFALVGPTSGTADITITRI